MHILCIELPSPQLIKELALHTNPQFSICFSNINFIVILALSKVIHFALNDILKGNEEKRNNSFSHLKSRTYQISGIKDMPLNRV